MSRRNRRVSSGPPQTAAGRKSGGRMQSTRTALRAALAVNPGEDSSASQHRGSQSQASCRGVGTRRATAASDAHFTADASAACGSPASPQPRLTWERNASKVSRRGAARRRPGLRLRGPCPSVVAVHLYDVGERRRSSRRGARRLDRGRRRRRVALAGEVREQQRDLLGGAGLVELRRVGRGRRRPVEVCRLVALGKVEADAAARAHGPRAVHEHADEAWLGGALLAAVVGPRPRALAAVAEERARVRGGVAVDVAALGGRGAEELARAAAACYAASIILHQLTQHTLYRRHVGARAGVLEQPARLGEALRLLHSLPARGGRDHVALVRHLVGFTVAC
mmetsp:Transcript_27905/g.99285  ORF Transcript_27905/g.99285 Transcript_27905/m.99285 type:complete len:338 (-) Transcript_27905:32-1045(-)